MAGSSVRNRASALTDSLRTELWPLPTVGVLLAVVLGITLPELDGHIDESLPDTVSHFLFTGGAGAARTVLDAVASSLITVTSLTFSLTVVTLQLASSQFSPRLLRTFTRDRFVHVTLALFLATFTYALTVLRVVRSDEDGQAAFVPQISVTLAFLLALASVIALVLFLAHLAQEIRVETMLRNVHSDAARTVDAVLAPDGDHPETGAWSEPTAGREVLLAAASGFLVSVDHDDLLAAAIDAGAVVLIDRRPGASLIDGTPMGSFWPLPGTTMDEDRRTRIREAAARSVLIGYERTATQDVGFGLRQLTDVTVKALSPGINDPTTAVHALGHASALLCQLVQRPLGDRLFRDESEEHAVRVVLARPDLEELLDVALTQPRRYGAADPAVLGRLVDLLLEVTWCATTDRHRTLIAEQLARLTTTIGAQDFDAHERAHLAERTRRVQRALTA